METASTLAGLGRPTAQQATYWGLSRPTSGWAVIRATVLKELRMTWRYKLDFASNFLDLGVRILFYLLLAGTAAFRGQGGVNQDLSGHDLFVFFQAGLLLMVFSGPTLWGPIHAVRNDLYNGTLEYLYSSPGSRYAYYVGVVLAKVLVNMVLFLPVYLILVFSTQASLGSVLLVLLTCLTMLVALTAMGITFSLLVLVWRQAGPVTGVLNLVFEMLTGAYIPVKSFPRFVQILVYPLPHTWGYDLIRFYAFDGDWNTLLPVWQEWILIVVCAVVLTIASRFLLDRAERLAKQRGLHGL